MERRRDRRHCREQEEKQRRKEAADAEVGSFQFLSDGILPSPRRWRDETGRKRRGERERREKRRM